MPAARLSTGLAAAIAVSLAACTDAEVDRLRAQLVQAQREHAADRSRLEQLAAQNHRLTGEAANAAASCTFQIAIAVEQATAGRRGAARPVRRATASAARRSTAGATTQAGPAPQPYLPLKPLTPDQVRALTDGLAADA